jgi:hypothetical protein
VFVLFKNIWEIKVLRLSEEGMAPVMRFVISHRKKMRKILHKLKQLHCPNFLNYPSKMQKIFTLA